MAVKITTNVNWQRKHQQQQQAGLLRFVTDVHRLATVYAPVETGHLRASGRVERITDGYKVKFGGSTGSFSVPYAKRRHFENRKNPQTLRYLERAGKQTEKNASKYFKDSAI